MRSQTSSITAVEGPVESRGLLTARYLVSGCVAFVLCSAWGCDAPVGSFPSNDLFIARLELTESIDLGEPKRDVSVALTDYFGTPDQPKWPSELASQAQEPLVQLERLTRAAGPVSSDEAGRHFGLYREHCVVCHGIAGNGRGPSSSLLNPYPRDFRHGKVKFKSTPTGEKPARDDLWLILEQGIVGTSMPSFGLLSDDDLEALIDYLVYLSVRGEVERRLLSYSALELDSESGERVYVGGDRASDAAGAEQVSFVEAEISSVLSSWHRASSVVTQVVSPPADFPLLGSGIGDSVASIENGKRLFQGNVAGCAFCHGQEAKGDGQINNYDDWTRDWTSLAGLRPSKLDELTPMLELGALKPRNILPRNLTEGIFRGGSRPEDLYLRIVNGIEGTPMPAAPLKPSNPQGLENSDVWDIVNYLLSLRMAVAAEAGDE